MADMRIEDPDPPGAPRPEEVFDKTWELELLISGGVVFALLQLPPLLENSFLRLEPRLTGWWKDASFFAFIYLKGILFTLIGAFILHLSSRAYWIGLIGLDKVYPEGVRWEKVTAGTITRRTLRELVLPLRPLILQVDRFCSSIFSIASLIVLAGLVSILSIGLYVLVALSLSWVMSAQEISNVFVLIASGFGLFLALPALLDKLLAGRLTPGGRMERVIVGGVRIIHRLQLGTIVSSVFQVLSTNLRRRTFLAILVIPFGMIFFFTVSHIGQRNSFWSSNAPMPEREIVPLYYEDQWPEEGASRLAPSIQSDVIEGPYLKLFIPYLPKRHDEVFKEKCPAPQARLDCVSSIHRVSVDGHAVSNLAYHFATHPKSGIQGFLAYIPAAGIPSGPHLLKIEPLPPREKRLFRRKAPQPFFIRFWI